MNSRRNKNKNLYKTYGDENGLCELAFELGFKWDDNGKFGVIWPPCTLRINAKDVHHIKGGNPRYDFLSNFSAIAGVPHHLFHFGCHGEQRPLRIACMLAKARKAIRINDPREFDTDEMDIVFGGAGRTVGYVESTTFDAGWEWMEPYRLELLELIG